MGIELTVNIPSFNTTIKKSNWIQNYISARNHIWFESLSFRKIDMGLWDSVWEKEFWAIEKVFPER